MYSSDIPNIITYLDKTFKEKNDINFKMKLFYLIGVNFGFIYLVSDAQTTHKNSNRHHA
jgi:hypothetical protein